MPVDGSGCRSRAIIGSVMMILTLASVIAHAQESGQPRRDFTFPIEADFDHGAANGNAMIMRLMPLASFPMGERWKVVNLTLAVVADAPGGVPGRPGNPEPIPGPKVFGLGDLTNAVFFTPPSRSPRLVWGFGPALAIPIATDEQLGSGKWSAGPALRIAYRPGSWNLGAAAIYLKSFAGADDRFDVNQVMIRGLIRCRLGDRWYFASNPIITANLDAAKEQRWLVPFGGGFGRRFTVGGTEMAISAQYYSNIIKPDGAPDGVFRIDVVVPIPRTLKRLWS